MYKLLLCWRYLLTRYLALVCIISVMLGVATLIVVNSVMAGFSTKLQERLHGLLSDIVIETYGISGLDRIAEKIDKIHRDPFLNEQIEVVTPIMEVFAILQHKVNGETVLKPVHLIGVDLPGRVQFGGFKEHLYTPENREHPSFELRGDARLRWLSQQENLARYLTYSPSVSGPDDSRPPLQPTPSEPPTAHGCMIGWAIGNWRNPRAGEPGQPLEWPVLEPGDEIVLTTAGIIQDPFHGDEVRPVPFRCAIVDYVKTDLSEYDSNFIYMPLEDLQKFRTMEGRATCLQVKLKDYRDYEHAKKIAKALQALFPNYYVATWQDKQGPLLAAIAVEKGILNVLLFLIVGVAGFGILAIFSMIVVEKTRDIGILKALGASNSGVMKIFLGYGLLLGVVGAGMGTILGLSFTIYINEIEHFLSKVTHQDIFPRSIYYFDRIPTDIQPLSVLLVNAGAILIAVLFSVLPALRAALLHPVRALRYE